MNVFFHSLVLVLLPETVFSSLLLFSVYDGVLRASCYFIFCFYQSVYIIYILLFKEFGTQIFISRQRLGLVHVDPCSWFQVMFKAGRVVRDQMIQSY